MYTMRKIFILAVVISITVELTNGKALERNPREKLQSQGRCKREAAKHEPAAIPETMTEKMVSTVVQTSTADFKKMLFPTSHTTDAPQFSDKTSAPTSSGISKSELNEIDIPEEPTADTLFDCYQEDIQPMSYEVSISPQMNSWIFDAETNVTIKVLKQCANLRLPKNNLTLTDINLISIESQIVPENNQLLEDSTSSSNFTVQFGKPISAGNYKLSLKYSGIIKVESQGRIDNSDGHLTGLIITSTRGLYPFKFEVVRMSFPLREGSGVRTNFSIAIKRDRNYKMALSNTHKIGLEEIKRNEATKKFIKNRPFAIHEVSYLLSNYRGLKCGINQLHHLRSCSDSPHFYQLDTMMNNMKTLTNLPYSQSGFEYLNVVILQEYNLSVSPLQILRCGLIITIHNTFILTTIPTSYGIAYQWFNCLVAPTVSSHKWLSTGLAAYYGEEIIPEKIYRNKKKYLNMMERMEAMIYNSDPTITSIISQIKDANTIHDRAVQMLLDHKAYSIIRMISNIIGKTKLRAAVENYLRNNLHQSTNSTDFINELKNVGSGDNMTSNIHEIIENWLSIQSLPSISVVRNYTTGNVTITQNPLLINNHLRAKLYNGIYRSTIKYESDTESSSDRFWIPINYVVSNNKTNHELVPGLGNKPVTRWLSPIEKSIMIPVEIDTEDWIIINKQQLDYYRVNYDTKNWRLIIKTLNSTSFDTIHIYNRIQLIDDAFSFLEAGELDYETIFGLIEYLMREDDYGVWTIAERHITRTFSALLESPEHNFKEYMVNASKAMANKAFPEYGYYYLHGIYPQLLTSVCRWGSALCSTLDRQYNNWLISADISDGETIPKEYPWEDSAQLSNLILCIGGQNIENNQTWTELENQWEDNPLVLNIITCRPDKTMVKNFYSGVFKSHVVSPKTFFYIIDLFIINNVETNIFSILRDVLKENLNNIKLMSRKIYDSDLMLELIDVIVSIENSTPPPFHTLRLFFKQNEARLETYFSRQEIRDYLLRTEINNLDLALPVFERFRKI